MSEVFHNTAEIGKIKRKFVPNAKERFIMLMQRETSLKNFSTKVNFYQYTKTEFGKGMIFNHFFQHKTKTTKTKMRQIIAKETIIKDSK